MFELQGISKRFGAVEVLRDVSLRFHPGEIHAICGENGAGKSTTMKIMTGIHQPDAGALLYEGNPLKLRSYRESLQRGIDIVHQEIQVIPGATVGENIMLDKLDLFTRRGRIDWRRLHQEAARYMKMVGLDLDPGTEIRGLSAAKKQLAQLAKALSADAKVLLLDEPTSSLTDHEAANLFVILKQLRDEGRTLIFVSHKLDEVFSLCDRISVLRDGRCVASKPVGEVTKEELVRQMIGRDSVHDRIGQLHRGSNREVLKAVGVNRDIKTRDIHFTLHQGEILGFYGLIGSGRTELARILIGDEKADVGEIFIKGVPAKMCSVGDSLRKHRLGYVTENRKEEGLLLDWPIVSNITVTMWQRIVGLFSRKIDASAERAVADRMFDEMNIRATGIDQKTGQLSGGNQQKVSLAKWLAADCDILIIDEPTVGVDIGAKDQIHRLIWDLAAEQGKSIILISSDMSEIIKLASRILVFREGRIVGEVTDVDSPEKSYEQTSTAIGGYLV